MSRLIEIEYPEYSRNVFHKFCLALEDLDIACLEEWINLYWDFRAQEDKGLSYGR
jgi:hypothetical protein